MLAESPSSGAMIGTYLPKFQAKSMVGMDRILLCREILVEEPYKFKHGSSERGQNS